MPAQLRCECGALPQAPGYSLVPAVVQMALQQGGPPPPQGGVAGALPPAVAALHLAQQQSQQGGQPSAGGRGAASMLGGSASLTTQPPPPDPNHQNLSVLAGGGLPMQHPAPGPGTTSKQVGAAAIPRRACNFVQLPLPC